MGHKRDPHTFSLLGVENYDVHITATNSRPSTSGSRGENSFRTALRVLCIKHGPLPERLLGRMLVSVGHIQATKKIRSKTIRLFGSSGARKTDET